MTVSTNVRWMLLASAASAGGTWAQYMIVARSGGPAALGAWAFAIALSAPVMSFLGLQTRTLLATDPARRYAFVEYRRVTAILSTLGAIGIAGFASLTGTAGSGGPAVLAAVCAMRALDLVQEVYYGLWQREERMSVIGWSRVVNAVGSVVLVGIACQMGQGVLGAAIASALGSGVSAAYVHLRTSSDEQLRGALRPEPNSSWRRLAALARQGVPLGTINLISMLQTSVPRFFIERYGGAAELGLFAGASQLTSAGNLLISAVGSAALPRFASYRVSGNEVSFRRFARKLATAGAVIGLVGIAGAFLLGRIILVVVYGQAFAAAHHLVVVLSLAAGAGFVATMLGCAMTAARVLAIQPAILLVTLPILAVSCFFLTPRMGATGAAWALFAGLATQAFLSHAALRRARVVEPVGAAAREVESPGVAVPD